MSLTHVLGPAGAAASPGEVAALASRLSSLSTQAEHARDVLTSRADLQWSGDAANTFRSTLGHLPGQLAKVAASFGDVSSSMWTYHGELEEILTEARLVSGQLDDINAHLARTQHSIASAHPDSPDLPGLHGTATVLKVERDAAERRAAALRARLKDASDACVRGIRSAGDAGIRNNPLHWLQTALGDVATGVRGEWHGIESVAKLFIEPFPAFYNAVVTFVEHPDWGTFATLLRASSSVAGEIALIAGIVAVTMATAGVGTLATMGLLATVADGALATGTVLGAATIGADVVGVSKHEVSTGDLVMDSVTEGLSVGSAVAGHAAGDLLTKGAGDVTEEAPGLAARGQDVLDQSADIKNLLSLTRDPETGNLSVRPLITHFQTYNDLNDAFLGDKATRYTTLVITDHTLDGSNTLLDTYNRYQSVTHPDPATP